MFSIYRNKSDIHVVLLDGKELKFTSNYCTNYSLYYDHKLGNILEYSENKIDYLEFLSNGKNVKLFGVREGNGDVFGVFINEDYKQLDFENEIVIDIGANIGDSAIYFALNGAKKVIALEPTPYSYDFAVKNINFNKWDEKVTILNAGYGTDGEIKVDEDKITNAGTSLEASQQGRSIKLYSLKTLIEQMAFNNNLVLKMDCEGCEYALLKEDLDTLKKIKRMKIEYHYGYETLVDRLRESNFKVQFTKPIKRYNRDAANPNMKLGMIFAERL